MRSGTVGPAAWVGCVVGPAAWVGGAVGTTGASVEGAPAVGGGVAVAIGGASVGGSCPSTVGAAVEKRTGVLVASGIAVPQAANDNNNRETASNFVTRIG